MRKLRDQKVKELAEVIQLKINKPRFTAEQSRPMVCASFDSTTSSLPLTADCAADLLRPACLCPPRVHILNPNAQCDSICRWGLW